MANERQIRPQPGPQTEALASSADVLVYGGSAGGGKTRALLMEPIRHVHLPTFNAMIFRRTTPELRNPGGLWDESCELYPIAGGRGSRHNLRWRFPNGATIGFSHMENEADRFNWQGSQIAMIGFDEVSHFEESQFWYLFCRLRSMCGIRPYVRATTNPDPDSFIARLIEWWIDPETGYAIKERSGVLRWFTRRHDELVWAGSRAELIDQYGPECQPKSLTFIPASVHDNRILLEKDPSYLANLQALPRVDRERLLGGNWKIRPAAGLYFRREWFETVEAPPAEAQRVRYWDRAGTKDGGDWTVGLKLAKTEQGILYVEDVVRFQGSPNEVELKIRNTATADGRETTVCLEQDPGQAGKAEVGYLVRQLMGFEAKAVQVTGDKETRAKPASSYAEAGNIKLVRARWNEALVTELENFPQGRNDDQVDALSGAFNELSGRARILFA